MTNPTHLSVVVATRRGDPNILSTATCSVPRQLFKVPRSLQQQQRTQPLQLLRGLSLGGCCFVTAFAFMVATATATEFRCTSAEAPFQYLDEVPVKLSYACCQDSHDLFAWSSADGKENGNQNEDDNHHHQNHHGINLNDLFATCFREIQETISSSSSSAALVSSSHHNQKHPASEDEDETSDPGYGTGSYYCQAPEEDGETVVGGVKEKQESEPESNTRTTTTQRTSIPECTTYRFDEFSCVHDLIQVCRLVGGVAITMDIVVDFVLGGDDESEYSSYREVSVHFVDCVAASCSTADLKQYLHLQTTTTQNNNHDDDHNNHDAEENGEDKNNNDGSSGGGGGGIIQRIDNVRVNGILTPELSYSYSLSTPPPPLHHQNSQNDNDNDNDIDIDNQNNQDEPTTNHQQNVDRHHPSHNWNNDNDNGNDNDSEKQQVKQLKQ